jgi:hypothetical protein
MQRQSANKCSHAHMLTIIVVIVVVRSQLASTDQLIGISSKQATTNILILRSTSLSIIISFTGLGYLELEEYTNILYS